MRQLSGLISANIMQIIYSSLQNLDLTDKKTKIKGLVRLLSPTSLEEWCLTHWDGHSENQGGLNLS